MFVILLSFDCLWAKSVKLPTETRIAKSVIVCNLIEDLPKKYQMKSFIVSRMSWKQKKLCNLIV